MRVFLADDHPLFRMGLRIALEREADISLVGEASDGFTAVEKIGSLAPDLCLIDVDMPGMSGIRVVRILRQENSSMKILILSTYDDEQYVRDAMRAGADGYVLKCVDVPELVRILKSYHEGRPILSPFLVHLAMDPSCLQEPPRRADDGVLTLREREVLRAIVDGLSNKQISDRYHISLETVKSHIKNIYQKLQVKNRTEAAMVATKSGLLD